MEKSNGEATWITLAGKQYKELTAGSLLEGCCYSGNNIRILLMSQLSLCGIQRGNIGQPD